MASRNKYIRNLYLKIIILIFSCPSKCIFNMDDLIIIMIIMLIIRWLLLYFLSFGHHYLPAIFVSIFCDEHHNNQLCYFVHVGLRSTHDISVLIILFVFLALLFPMSYFKLCISGHSSLSLLLQLSLSFLFFYFSNIVELLFFRCHIPVSVCSI